MGSVVKPLRLGSVTVTGTDLRFSHCTYIPDVTVTLCGSNPPEAVIVTSIVLAGASTVAVGVLVALAVPVGGAVPLVAPVGVAVAVIVGVAPARTGVRDDGTAEGVAATGVVAAAVAVVNTG